MVIETNEGKDFLAYEKKGDANTVEITDIAVNSNRRTGIGTSLVNKLIEMSDKPCNIYVLCRRDNRIALKFYLSNQFTILSPLMDFYIDRDKEDKSKYKFVDALILTRTVIS